MKRVGYGVKGLIGRQLDGTYVRVVFYGRIERKLDVQYVTKQSERDPILSMVELNTAIQNGSEI